MQISYKGELSFIFMCHWSTKIGSYQVSPLLANCIIKYYYTTWGECWKVLHFPPI